MSKFNDGDKVVDEIGVGFVGRNHDGTRSTFPYAFIRNGAHQYYFNQQGKKAASQVTPSVFTIDEVKRLGLTVIQKVTYHQILIKKEGKLILHPELFRTKEEAEKIPGYVGMIATGLITVNEELSFDQA